MRCKKHLSDYSSAIGVCATCLRQRLFILVQAQSNPNSISDNPNPNNSLSSSHHHHHQKHQEKEQPPPLIFPRSVSPYIARRKSDQTSINNSKPIIQRFYSTPQVGPTTHQKKKNSGKFSLITKLFRSKSSVAEVGVGSTRRRNRGMSPQSEWDEEEAAAAGPAELTRPSPGRTRPSHVTSLALCLSPLVRASPASRYNWGIEPSFSGEIRVPATGKVNGGVSHANSINKEKPQLGDAASFCANRSRKIADFGRFNRNR